MKIRAAIASAATIGLAAALAGTVAAATPAAAADAGDPCSITLFTGAPALGIPNPVFPGHHNGSTTNPGCIPDVPIVTATIPADAGGNILGFSCGPLLVPASNIAIGRVDC
ncbi:hypothetical protein [Promicromonospora kroppenstedtii]|uniref:hypothetical protein n=1 Tax=Promicromonospora kroppenstedtii TaxID=440482 RepID=UPI0004BC4451|nr:hypothetical protein [Promicromonospora kroppenstedtii]